MVVCGSSEIVEATVVIRTGVVVEVVEDVIEGDVLVMDDVVTISEDEVVIKLGIIVGIEEVVVSMDDEVTTIELDTVVAALESFVKIVAAEVVCVNLFCSSIVLEVIPVNSTEDVVDIGVSLVVSELCIPRVVIDCVVISSGITVFVSIVDCSVITLFVVSGAKVVSFISSSGMDKSNP